MEIKQSRPISGISIIEFSCTGHLLHPENLKLFDTIKSTLEQIDRGELQLVLLYSQTPHEDCSQNWLSYLNGDVLRYTLTQHITKTRQILSDVKKSRVPWVFIADQDCLGSVFELALYCRLRLWFSTNANVGFPEINYGFFPPLGSLEFNPLASQIFLKIGESFGIFSSIEAEKVGLIDKVIDFKDWQSKLSVFVDTYIPNLLAERKLTGKLRLHAKTLDKFLAKAKVLRKTPIGEDQRFLRDLSPYWVDYINFLKQKDRLLEVLQTSYQAIYEHASEQLTNVNYISFLLSSREKSKLRYPAQNNSIQTILIVCHDAPPPKNSLLRIYDSKRNIILAADNQPNLIRNIEIIFHRFSHLLSQQELNDFWRRRVTWQMQEFGNSALPVFKWDLNHNLILKLNEKNYFFTNLESNFQSYSSTFYEHCGSLGPDPEALISLAAIVSKGIIVTKPFGLSKMTVSTLVKFLFLQELVSLTEKQGRNLSQLLDALKDSGWKSVSARDHWDLFLAQENLIFDPSESERNLLNHFVEQKIVELLDFSSIEQMTAGKRNSKERWNPTRVSIHMSIFCGLVTKFLVAANLCQSYQAANFLTAKSVGFPVDLGTPLGMHNRYNESRLIYHIKLNWPSLDPNFCLKHIP